MLLCIDIGNTNITFGLFEGDKLGPSWRIRTIHEKMPDEYGILLDQLFRHQGRRPDQVTGSVIASVVPPLTPVFAQVCRDYLGQTPLVVDAGVRTGVRIRYDNPRQVGADRVVDAAAVRVLYGVPACVVDFGTATTFDAVSADGEYLGGAIAPGIGIAAPMGTEVYAVADGTVLTCLPADRRAEPAWGSVVAIAHRDHVVSWYAQLDRVLVRSGARVSKAQAIGTVGASGAVRRPELAFRLYRNERPVDPLKLLP